jgi:RNA polymerase sigma-70 factor, ECF subfamily
LSVGGVIRRSRHGPNWREEQLQGQGGIHADLAVVGLNPAVVEIKTPDTRSLLELVRAGDAEAYGEVYRAHAARLLRHAMGLCGNAALAEELAHDTLVESWKCLRRYNGRCGFFTWLCAILLNRYRNSIRNNRLLPVSSLGRREQDEFSDTFEKLADRSLLPDEAAALREQTALLWRSIETLPVKHQQVIYLRFYVDDSLEGIAAALGCSVGTVKSRLFHALDRLRGMNALNAHFVNLRTKG